MGKVGCLSAIYLYINVCGYFCYYIRGAKTCIFCLLKMWLNQSILANLFFLFSINISLLACLLGEVGCLSAIYLSISVFGEADKKREGASLEYQPNRSGGVFQQSVVDFINI
jgi:hypothetical protein